MINAFGEHDVFGIYTTNYVIVKTRSSRSEVFCKKGVPINFAKFTGKHLCQSLFLNKAAGPRPMICQGLSAIFIITKLQHKNYHHDREQLLF